MDYLRQRQLVDEAIALHPSWGATLAAHTLSPAELDELQYQLDNYKRKRACLDEELKQMARQGEEYDRESERIELLLKSDPLYAPPSKAAQEAARKLAAAASDLGLCVADEPAMVAALVQRGMDDVGRRMQEDQREFGARRLAELCRALEASAAQLHGALDAAAAAQAREGAALPLKRSHTAELNQKAEEYKRRCEAFQARLVNLGFSDKLTHTSLAALGAAGDALQAQLEAVQQELAAYHGVPSSTSKLRELLERTQRELLEVQQANAQSMHRVG